MKADIDRTKANLAWIAANPTSHYPQGWIDEVQAEARKLGLLPPEVGPIGCNCQPGIDRKIVYGADMIEAF